MEAKVFGCPYTGLRSSLSIRHSGENKTAKDNSALNE
jgi:hypothetical protein